MLERDIGKENYNPSKPEAGYRCAVPGCRKILTLELHHIDPVRGDGENAPDNLIALCPNCHTMLEQGMITREAINMYKTLLVSLSQTFEKESISPKKKLYVTGDGVLKFSHLIASDFAEFEQYLVSGPLVFYEVCLTNKGERIIEAWFSGSMKQDRQALNDISFEGNMT
jgi:hypothetical protein